MARARGILRRGLWPGLGSKERAVARARGILRQGLWPGLGMFGGTNSRRRDFRLLI